MVCQVKEVKYKSDKDTRLISRLSSVLVYDIEVLFSFSLTAPPDSLQTIHSQRFQRHRIFLCTQQIVS